MLKSSGHGVHTRDGFTYCFFFFFVLLAVADDDGESPLVFFPLSLEEEEEEAAAAFPSVASLEIIVLFFSLSTFPFSYTTSRQLLSNIIFFFGVVFVVTISLLKLISRNRCCRFYVAGYDGESPLVFLSVAAVAASQALHPLKETIALPPYDFTIPKNRKPELRF